VVIKSSFDPNSYDFTYHWMNTNQKEAMAAENQVSSTEVKANGVCKGVYFFQIWLVIGSLWF